MFIKKLINYLAVFIVFSGSYSWTDTTKNPFAEVRLLYFIIFFLFLLMLPFIKGIYFHRGFLVIFSILTISSLYNIYIGRDTIGAFTKQFIGISTSAVFFYMLFRINNYDVKGLFKIYLNLALVVGMIGIIQEVSFLLNFKPGYDFKRLLFLPQRWQVANKNLIFLSINSILSEPTNFCNVMLPAFFVSLTSFFRNNFIFQKRWKSWIIIVSFILTFSATGYFGILFVLLLLLYNNRKLRYIILVAAIVAAAGYYIYSNVYAVRIRISDSVDIMTGKKELKDVNLSVYALFSNAFVTSYSLKDNPIFGRGLGSHEVSYRRHVMEECVIQRCGQGSILNYNDAASLFLRLLSETGLFGLLALLIFIFKFYVPGNRDRTGYLWIISGAVLTMFFLKLLRMGHYFSDGFFFFLWIYYFTWRARNA